MKQILFFTSFLIVIAQVSFSQTRIALQKGEETLIFNHFPNALAAAEDGDVIYLPGGAIDIGISYIEKSISIFGAGHYPQYTQATGVTMLNGTLYMRQADTEVPLENIHLEGFSISGDIRIGTNSSNQNVNQVTIKRCSMNNLYLSSSGSNGQADQIHVIENVIRGTVYGGDAQNLLFSKNIVQGQFYYLNGNALVRNNIFLHTTNSSVTTSFRYITNSVFANNVMLCSSASTCFNNMSANTFNNNMWRFEFSVPSGSNGGNNIYNENQQVNEIFVNHTGHTFSYDFNYQLSEGSPGINAGTDETDIGIYGTNRPYKEGAVPSIPHIISRSIANETDTEGKLQVEIEVKAQEE